MLSNAEYHAHPAISASNVKAFLKSPLHYWATKLDPNQVQRPPTPAMQLGTAVHAAVLEPERFSVEYGIGLDLPRRTNADKAAHAAHESQYEQVLSPADYKLVTGMRDALLSHSEAGPLLEAAMERESSHFITCPRTGLELKCRPDGLLPMREEVLDIKTASDIGGRKIRYAVTDFGYDTQAVHYLHCLGYRSMLHCWVENTAPHAVRVVRLGGHFLGAPRHRYLTALEGIANHTRLYGTADPWPAYPGITNLQ